MELALPGFFLEDLEELEGGVREEVLSMLKKLEEEGTEMEEFGLASRTDMDIQVFRLTVKDGEKGIDHRIIFDIIDGKAYPVAVGHRDNVYETGEWETVGKRLKKL